MSTETAYKQAPAPGFLYEALKTLILAISSVVFSLRILRGYWILSHSDENRGNGVGHLDAIKTVSHNLPCRGILGQ